MTDAENAALEWLRVAFSAEGTSRWHWFPDANDMKQAATLKAMLAQPRLPEEPSEEALNVMAVVESIGFTARHRCTNIYRTLYVHLTAPLTLEEEVRRYGT